MEIRFEKPIFCIFFVLFWSVFSIMTGCFHFDLIEAPSDSGETDEETANTQDHSDLSSAQTSDDEPLNQIQYGDDPPITVSIDSAFSTTCSDNDPETSEPVFITALKIDNRLLTVIINITQAKRDEIRAVLEHEDFYRLEFTGDDNEPAELVFLEKGAITYSSKAGPQAQAGGRVVFFALDPDLCGFTTGTIVEGLLWDMATGSQKVLIHELEFKINRKINECGEQITPATCS